MTFQAAAVLAALLTSGSALAMDMEGQPESSNIVDNRGNYGAGYYNRSLKAMRENAQILPQRIPGYRQRLSGCPASPVLKDFDAHMLELQQALAKVPELEKKIPQEAELQSLVDINKSLERVDACQGSFEELDRSLGGIKENLIFARASVDEAYKEPAAKTIEILRRLDSVGAECESIRFDKSSLDSVFRKFVLDYKKLKEVLSTRERYVDKARARVAAQTNYLRCGSVLRKLHRKVESRDKK